MEWKGIRWFGFIINKITHSSIGYHSIHSCAYHREISKRKNVLLHTEGNQG